MVKIIKEIYKSKKNYRSLDIAEISETHSTEF
jgi:hypothetical protein